MFLKLWASNDSIQLKKQAPIRTSTGMTWGLNHSGSLYCLREWFQTCRPCSLDTLQLHLCKHGRDTDCW